MYKIKIIFNPINIYKILKKPQINSKNLLKSKINLLKKPFSLALENQ